MKLVLNLIKKDASRTYNANWLRDNLAKSSSTIMADGEGLGGLIGRFANNEFKDDSSIGQAFTVTKTELKINNIDHLYNLANAFKKGDKARVINKNPGKYAICLALIIFQQGQHGDKGIAVKYVDELAACFTASAEVTQALNDRRAAIEAAQKVSPRVSLADNSKGKGSKEEKEPSANANNSKTSAAVTATGNNNSKPGSKNPSPSTSVNLPNFSNTTAGVDVGSIEEKIKPTEALAGNLSSSATTGSNQDDMLNKMDALMPQADVLLSGVNALQPTASTDTSDAEKQRLAAVAQEAEKQRLAAVAQEAEKQRLAAVAQEAEKQRLAAVAQEAEKQRLAAVAQEAEKQRLAAVAQEAEKQRLAAVAQEAEKQRLAAVAQEAEKQRLAAVAQEAEKQRLAAVAQEAEKQRLAAVAQEAEKQRLAAVAQEAEKQRLAAVAQEAEKQRLAAVAQEAEKQRLAAVAQEAEKQRLAVVAQEAEKQRLAAVAQEAEKQRLAAVAQEAEKQRLAAVAQEAEKQRLAAVAQEAEKQRLAAVAQEAEKQRLAAVAQEAEKQRLAAVAQEAEKQRLAVVAQEAEKQRLAVVAQEAEKQRLAVVAQETEKQRLATVAKTMRPVSSNTSVQGAPLSNVSAAPVPLSLAARYKKQENVGFFGSLRRGLQSIFMGLYSIVTSLSLNKYRQWRDANQPLAKLEMSQAGFNTLAAYRRGLQSPMISGESQLPQAQVVDKGKKKFIFADKATVARLEFYQARQKGADKAKPLSEKEKANLLRSKEQSVQVGKKFGL